MEKKKFNWKKKLTATYSFTVIIDFLAGTETSENSSELHSEKESDAVSDTDSSSSERKRSKCITGATPKSSKKTKVEKSIETVCLSLRESSEAEMKR